MIECPNCGTSNPEGSRFCANCGADLSAAAGTTDPGEPIPLQYVAPTVPPSHMPPTAPQWRMSDAGPLPEPPRRRRTWL